MNLVVNVKHDHYDVYVGRRMPESPAVGESTPGADGYFGNPFRHGFATPDVYGPGPGETVKLIADWRGDGLFGRDDIRRFPDFIFPMSKTGVLEMHCAYTLRRMKADPMFAERVMGLKGKRLGCWCAQRGGVTHIAPAHFVVRTPEVLAGNFFICHAQTYALIANT